MCGIFGYVGTKPCNNLLLKGLKSLEYRGYDSAGIATVSSNHRVSVIKKKGKVSTLEGLIDTIPSDNTVGIGHTRWATHGFANDINAHPHKTNDFTIVHNGIIDNYLEIKNSLIDEGIQFSTETDSEVILQLLQKNFTKSKSVAESIQATTKELKGSFALGVLFALEPQVLYLVKKKSPLIIGKGSSENFFASDLIALAPHTHDFIFLEDHQYARLTHNSIEVKDFNNKKVNSSFVKLSDFNISNGDKAPYDHYMLKEIHEQKEIVSSHIESFYDKEYGLIKDFSLGLSKLDLTRFNHLILVGCGSAYYAACTGQYTLEKHLKIPVTTSLASEFRYRRGFLGEKTLILALSQSGETADTLSSAEYAKNMGSTVIAICNTPYSSLTRLSDFTMYIQAGTEVGVAATKTFTATLLSLMTLSYFFAKKLGNLEKNDLFEMVENLVLIPSFIDEIIAHKSSYKKVAESNSQYPSFLFMGRGHSYPIALEGALKLKEISYIHAEGYAGGELKHGPISLVTDSIPIVAVCPEDASYKKMLSNIEEVVARKGKVIAVTSKNDPNLKNLAQDILPCPQVKEPLLQALLSNIPLQLFAYYTALDLKKNIDQPRNLAKSVTVE